MERDIEEFREWLLKVRGYPPHRVKKIICRILRISLRFDVYHTKPEEIHGFGRGRVTIKQYRATLREFHKFLQNRDLLKNIPGPQPKLPHDKVTEIALKLQEEEMISRLSPEQVRQKIEEIDVQIRALQSEKEFYQNLLESNHGGQTPRVSH